MAVDPHFQRLPHDRQRLILEGDDHQRLGARPRTRSQRREVGRLIAADRYGAQRPLPRILEAAGQPLTVRVVYVEQPDVVEASLAGQAGQHRPLGGVGKGGAEEATIVCRHGELRRGGRGTDRRHPGRPGDRLRDRQRHRAGGGAPQ